MHATGTLVAWPRPCWAVGVGWSWRHLMLLLWLSMHLVSRRAGSSMAQEPASRITRIEFAPATVDEGGGVFITLVGSGRCSYTHRLRRRHDRQTHRRAAGPASGTSLPGTASTSSSRRPRRHAKASRAPSWTFGRSPAASGDSRLRRVRTALTPACSSPSMDAANASVTLDFGDGTIDKVAGVLPQTRNHRYERMGVYDLKATRRTAMPW